MANRRFDSRNFNFAAAHHLSFEKYKQVLSKKLFHRAHSKLCEISWIFRMLVFC